MRIMGNCLSLAVFYTCERSWNPYRESGALQERLKAALDFWTRLQQEDGRFSEYGDGELNLALTAFATKLIRETLVVGANGPPRTPTYISTSWRASGGRSARCSRATRCGTTARVTPTSTRVTTNMNGRVKRSIVQR